MLGPTANESMLGLRKSEAGNDLVTKKKAPVKKERVYEEWNGIESP